MYRDITLDIMKGVAIIAVIAGHSLPLDSMGRQIIYSFHMPLFFIVAGYLYKPNRQYKQKFSYDFRRLIFPYFVIAIGFTIYLLTKEADKLYAFKYSIIATIFGSACNHASFIWGTAPRIGAAWFLPALFWCRQIFNLIFTQTKHSYVIIAGLAFLAVLTDRHLINLPFALLTGMSSMIYYLIGYQVHIYKFERRYLFLLGIVGSIAWLMHLLYFGIEMSICFYGFYPIDILGTSFATAIIFFASKNISSTHIGEILGSIGRLSLYVYCFHVLEAEIKPYELLQLEDSWYLEIPIRTAWCLLAAYLYQAIKNIIKVQE